jgi:NhaP-type Na+/H+ and K+/H+ antiporter
MDKKTYYVTVQTGEILDDPTAFSYDFVIYANEQELHQLQELFENTQDAEHMTYWRTWIPSPVNQYDEENAIYDENLREIYKKLHTLGSTETKQHIETMNVLI